MPPMESPRSRTAKISASCFRRLADGPLINSRQVLTRGVFAISGINPMKTRYIGRVGAAQPARRARWLADIRMLGREGH